MPNQHTTRRKSICVIGPSIAYIPLSKEQFALVDSKHAASLDQFQWTASWRRNSDSYYAVRAVWIDGKQKMIGMHQVICMCYGKDVPDHVSSSTLDNREANLRPATRAQNIGNSRLSKRNALGLKGVTKVGRLYHAKLYTEGHSKNLGRFDSPEEAHQAYRMACIAKYGEFARF